MANHNEAVYSYAATINKVSGVDAIHVPFRGTSDAIAALGLGDIDYFLDAPSAFEPLVRQGKAKVVAATTAKRTIDRPDVPGMEEEGLALDLLITYGIVTPKGVPREVVTTARALPCSSRTAPKWAASAT